jgi:N-terminal half of MaoC dehydratase
MATASGESIEGRSGEPFTMVVELGKVRELARATRSRNPAYDGAPGDTPVSPATFLMSAAFWTGPASDPWRGVDRNVQRLLHGEQEFVFHGEPPRAGDVLTGRSRIDRVYTKQGKRGGSMTFAETVTEFRDPSGRLVAETRSTTIETSQATTEG